MSRAHQMAFKKLRQTTAKITGPELCAGQIIIPKDEGSPQSEAAPNDSVVPTFIYPGSVITRRALERTKLYWSSMMVITGIRTGLGQMVVRAQ